MTEVPEQRDVNHVGNRPQKYCSHSGYIDARFGAYTSSNAVSECLNTQIS